ncbi:GyrI-like domain-containing protein [Candidatus Latescibacterota bacterium]
MNLALIILLIALGFVFVLTAVLARYGLFVSVKISEQEVGPYVLVCENHVGPYQNTGPIMDKIYYDLKDNFRLETTKGFGIYYDNPREVAKDELRSIAGCIVETKSLDETKQIIDKYKIMEFPASKSVVTEFPFKGKLSVFVGIFKVYPKLAAFAAERSYAQKPIMEMYDMPNAKIVYISSVHLDDEVFDSFLK